MFRRTFWFTAGAATGIWATTRVHRALRALEPDALAARALDRAALAGRRARAFAGDVREGMARRERELGEALGLADDPDGREPHRDLADEFQGRHRADGLVDEDDLGEVGGVARRQGAEGVQQGDGVGNGPGGLQAGQLADQGDHGPGEVGVTGGGENARGHRGPAHSWKNWRGSMCGFSSRSPMIV
ncbi:DUF6167 family protein [Streptomyces calidiresistens]|uniref:Secreted protein n=1 Tax=Streptomyces calidiresistens TaxID=1485586 RepID=A0A7W3T612_9ACTN|nr:hypothetical protein [Streptomyces calidiresistens]